jgi:hypothetical protein
MRIEVRRKKEELVSGWVDPDAAIPGVGDWIQICENGFTVNLKVESRKFIYNTENELDTIQLNCIE